MLVDGDNSADPVDREVFDEVVSPADAEVEVGDEVCHGQVRFDFMLFGGILCAIDWRWAERGL